MRLIDADATYELLKSLGSRDYRREKGTICEAMKMVAYEDYTPTVDAVQVVRCKNCIHWQNPEGICWQNIMWDEDEYCSRGERKE